MKLYLNDMLYAISYALDNVEREYRHVELFHADRVAYIAVQMGRMAGLKTDELLDLAAAAVMHDNAFTEYLNYLDKLPSMMEENLTPQEMAAAKRPHCEMGERNAQYLPCYSRIKNAILYHHENADGSGAFGKMESQTPFYARLIHFSDELDNTFSLDNVDDKQYGAILKYLEENNGKIFGDDMVRLFKAAFPSPTGALFNAPRIRQLLQCDLPHVLGEYSDDDVEGLGTVIAHIIDHKSHFTCTHSLGIAKTAGALAGYLGYDREKATRLYLAGSLHDVGKLTIPSEILEKPDRLTKLEFDVMKTHAIASWNILRTIDGMDDVVEWACFHHEKLNGSGYPFGKTAKELSPQSRIIACADIYQALTEDRPYKEGIPHKEAIRTMMGMVKDGLIDAQIVIALDACFGR